VSGGGRRPALTRAEVLFFCHSPAGIKLIKKNKKEQPWRGADGKQGEENANGVVRLLNMYSDAYLPVPIFLGSGDPLTLISVQRMF